jgi:hypothetical protein
MYRMLVTAPVLHEPMGWLNMEAPWNMLSMFVTAAVFQLLMDALPPLLNAVALLNMAPMSVTALVFHEPMFWLKEDANSNILFIFVTWLVFQLPMF